MQQLKTTKGTICKEGAINDQDVTISKKGLRGKRERMNVSAKCEKGRTSAKRGK